MPSLLSTSLLPVAPSPTFVSSLTTLMHSLPPLTSSSKASSARQGSSTLEPLTFPCSSTVIRFSTHPRWISRRGLQPPRP
ncbi:hypothetical protein QJS04_geneDACA007405 [Acorus gramineus]|uniref:Secreted protein n=1 Tax=Acorus gramineus TaxID=55184 RepID=A0AAV9BMT4_ACOGR|nr:hypothetical protein QJS04_geneDACA007405 [Acorus gramineus]